MNLTAKINTQGEIVVPDAVRAALEIESDHMVVFHIDGTKVTLTKAQDFIALAGTVNVPENRHDTTWDDVVGFAHTERGNLNLDQ